VGTAAELKVAASGGEVLLGGALLGGALLGAELGAALVVVDAGAPTTPMGGESSP